MRRRSFFLLISLFLLSAFGCVACGTWCGSVFAQEGVTYDTITYGGYSIRVMRGGQPGWGGSEGTTVDATEEQLADIHRAARYVSQFVDRTIDLYLCDFRDVNGWGSLPGSTISVSIPNTGESRLDHPAVHNGQAFYKTLMHEMGHNFGIAIAGSYDPGTRAATINHGRTVESPGGHLTVKNWLLGGSSWTGDIPFFTEIEMAIMLDGSWHGSNSGLHINLANHFGYSEYRDGEVLTINSDFAGSDNSYRFASGTWTSDQIMAVGLHLVGEYQQDSPSGATPVNAIGNQVTLDANIVITGDGGTGIRLENNLNTVTVSAGRTLASNGEQGVGVLFTRATDSTLTNYGRIEAAGLDGRGVWFNSSVNTLENHGTIYARQADGTMNTAIMVGNDFRPNNNITDITVNLHDGSDIEGNIVSTRSQSIDVTGGNVRLAGDLVDLGDGTISIADGTNLTLAAGGTDNIKTMEYMTDLILGLDSTLTLQVDLGTNNMSDLINVTGTANIGNSVVIDVVTWDVGTYTIMSASNLLDWGGGYSILIGGESMTGRFNFDVRQEANDIVMNVSGNAPGGGMANMVVTWTGARSNVWDVALSDNWTSPNDTRFYHNDSVIFNLAEGREHLITVNSNVKISKDSGRVTGDQGTGERGMRVSGSDDWIFVGGSIGDNYSVTADTNAGTDPSLLAALVFDGSGKLTLNNDEPNTYHDGTIISGGGELTAKNVDMLGSTEFIGQRAASGVVQNSGYGIEFSNLGGTLVLQNGSTLDPVTGLPSDLILEQRIGVASNSSGTLTVARNASPLVVTADADYQTYAPNKNGGAVHVGQNADFTASGEIVFTQNMTDQNGGAIFADSSASVTVDRLLFVANEATSGGAFYGGTQGSISAVGTQFYSNEADQGGAVYLAGAAGADTWNFQNAVFGALENQPLPLPIPTASSMGNAADQGGAMYLANGVNGLNLAGAKFYANAATAAGGAIYAGSSVTLDIQDAAFRQNTAVTNGGAIFGDANFQIDANGADFIENMARTSGGAVYAGNSLTATLEEANFTGNVATNSGGAIFAGNTATLSTLKVEFAGNVVTNGAGGAILLGNSYNVHFQQGRFLRNVAGAAGGAMVVGNSGNFVMQGTVFTENTAGTTGGAISAGTGATMSLRQIELTRNTAGTDGGAFAVGTGSSIVSEFSAYNRNTAAANGGAIAAASDSVIELDGSVFTSNQAGQSGGAVYSVGGAGSLNILDMDGASFQNNSADGAGNQGHGGAVYAVYTDLGDGGAALSFRGNQASGHGGAIYAGEGTARALDLTGTILAGNVAGLDGGALFAAEMLNLNATNAQFAGNVAQNGGAIHAAGGDLQLGGTRFQSNQADENGGAIVIGTAGTASHIGGANTEFSHNEAENGSGGAIYAVDTNLNLHNAQFRDNSAGEKGGAILMETTGIGSAAMLFTVDTNVTAGFSGNTAGGVSSSIHFVGTGSAVTDIDLRFETAQNGTFELLDSLSVDAANAVQLDIVKNGDGTLVLGNAHDLRNTATASTMNVHSGTLDMQNGAQLLLTHSQGGDSFTMTGGTWLQVNGNNVIDASSILITDKIGFNLNGTAPNSESVALRLVGEVDTVSGEALGAGDINITDFVERNGLYNLVQAEDGALADTGDLYYKGVLVENNDRLIEYMALRVDAANSVLQVELRPWENTDMTWTGTENDTWDVGAHNWTGCSEGQAVTQFIDGDSVLFGDTGAGTIDVTVSGVVVDAMTIDSQADYVFQGGEVTGSLLQKWGGGELTMDSRFEFDRFEAYGGTVTGGRRNEWSFVGDMDFKAGSALRPNAPFLIDGDLTMRGGSFLQWELGNAASQNSLVMATGTIDLGRIDNGVTGPMVIGIANNGVNGGQYASDAAIIVATEGIMLGGGAILDGIYGTDQRKIEIELGGQTLVLLSDRSLALQAVLVEADSTELSLIAIGTGFDATGPTSDDFNKNQLTIYAALENAAYQTVANDFFVELAKLGSVEAKADALDAMLTTVNSASMLVAERNILEVNTTVFDRLRLLNETRYQQHQQQRGGQALGQVPSPSGRLNLSPWVTQLGDFVDQDASGSANGFRADTYGFMLGVDRGYGGHLVFGLGLGGTFSNVHAGSRQSGKVNTFMATGYGSYVINDWTLSANVGVASSDYTFERRVFTLRTESKLGGESVFGGVELSKMLRYNGWDVLPYASLNLVTLDVDSFHDAALDGVGGMTVDSGSSSSWLQTFGVRLGRSVTGRRSGIWTPALNLGWIHDYGKGQLRSTTTFGGGTPFTVIGAERARDRILLGLGTNVALRRLTVFGSYDMEVSKHFFSHTLQAGLNVAF